MQSILRLIRADLVRVSRNVIAVIVLFGVVVIPSFFGWFNVLSSWDPFGNVKNLKVAVANADEGFQSDLFPMSVNIGEQVISNLRANSDLNWVFATEEEAIEGTKSGEYYAALVLPKDFSQQMLTFLAPGAKPAEIDYYSNEKENALSPKITDEAATDVSTEINETFTKTLNEVGLSVISMLAQTAGSSEAQDAIGRLQASVGSAASQLDSGANTLDMFSALISSSKAMVGSASRLTDSAVDAVQSSSGAINQGANAAASLKTVLSSATDSIAQALSGTSTSYGKLIDQIIQLESSFGDQTTAASTVLDAVAAQVGDQISQQVALRDDFAAQAAAATDPVLRDALNSLVTSLDTAISSQTKLQDRILRAASSIDNAGNDTSATFAEISALAKNAKQAVDGVSVTFETELRPKLDELAGTLGAINLSLGGVGDELINAAQILSGGAGSLEDALTQAGETTSTIAKDLRSVSDKFTKLESALGIATDTGDFTMVEELIGTNASILAGELSSPVGLKTIEVFKVDTFGAQMAPFYTVLGLWVGALLLAVLIRTDVGPHSMPYQGPLTKTQEYFGRYGIFALLGFFQSSLMYLGLLGFVGVRAEHPGLLLLAGWVMSLVFTLITYTLVLSFGEAGKAFAVFLLVVQISAGGGAYPLAVLPQWFQNLSPWLPVTHATNALRSAIAGIYHGDYWISLGQLALFLVPTLLIGLVLRLPVLKLNTGLANALASTKLM